MPITSHNLSIRKANLDDLLAIRKIDKHLFNYESYPVFVLRQFLDITNGLVKVAALAEETVGYTIGHYNQETAEAWVLSLGVMPGHRGKQIGQKLQQELLNDIAAKGASKITLTVHPENASAIRIYEKSGFVKTEAQQDYYLDGTPRLLMVKQLNEVKKVEG
ncbi:GNAT family N-acetyltransferase [Pontibacter harenae]|uniref:GNAT family N-acetyltransferase n=1 Tax=Pontibacter harenae TaxID=2894083 RepID=UPI001E60B2CC|nr:N-acetyltransferase [Pontibacter harenae]MCC9168291.1 GNAT family N-acetyltransferase [Pontibacter harenae]